MIKETVVDFNQALDVILDAEFMKNSHLVTLNVEPHFSILSKYTSDIEIQKVILESIVIEYNCIQTEHINTIKQRTVAGIIITMQDLGVDEVKTVYDDIVRIIDDLFNLMNDVTGHLSLYTVFVYGWHKNGFVLGVHNDGRREE
jgi:hypothetical protein